jgi:hypothetical protein
MKQYLRHIKICMKQYLRHSKICMKQYVFKNVSMNLILIAADGRSCVHERHPG